MRTYLILFLILIGCDKVRVDERDIMKYPDIAPFVLSNESFKGAHDLDLGLLHFSYQPKASLTMDKIDSIASAESWDLVKKAKLERVYAKKIKSHPGDMECDSLFVEFKPRKNRLYFEWY